MGRGLMAGLALAIVAGACSGDAEPPPLTDPSTTPTTATTAATATSTTSTTPTATMSVATSAPTTTVTPAETVGDIAAFERQIDEVYERLGQFAAPRDEVPFPDVTNPDPLVAFQSLIEFHFWTLIENPWRDWVTLYALKDSPYETMQTDIANAFSSTNSRYVFEASPFDLTNATRTSLASVQPPSDLLDEPTAVAIEWTSSSGPFRTAFVETGATIEEFDGWLNRVSHAVVVPTDAGWRIAFLEWLP